MKQANDEYFKKLRENTKEHTTEEQEKLLDEQEEILFKYPHGKREGTILEDSDD